MNRVPSVLREAAALLARDFGRALPVQGDWRIDVSDDFVVSVAAEGRAESVLISKEVYDPEWFDVGETDAERHDALLDEATEVLSHEVSEVLDLWGRDLPRCREHFVPLGVCTGVWYCPESHDVCLVGELSAADVASARG